MTLNMLKVQIRPSRVTVAATGRRPGSVTVQKRCKALAPSTDAASSRSASIDCSPPRNATIMDGIPSQTLTVITENFAHVGSLRNDGETTPIFVSSCATKPYGLLKMKRHEKAEMKDGTAHGT